MLDLVAGFNQRDAERNGDAEVLARVAQYEMAFRMQTAVPDLTDISNENPASLALYGPHASKPGTFANNCLLARRLAERGVRFIQLYHRGWDSHWDVPRDIPTQCGDVDQPQGTSIELAYRGAINIVSQVINPVVTTNARSLDGYGDFYQPPAMGPTLHNNPNPTFNFLNDSAWHDDVSDIDGVPYYQIRITFLSNIETALSPELSALGITWQVQN